MKNKMPHSFSFSTKFHIFVLIFFLGIFTVHAQIITTVAGNGTLGGLGDGGLAVAAELNNPLGVAVDASGNIYISDNWNFKIRKITASTGIITTIAGTGVQGFSGDSGLALLAKIDRPRCVALDSTGSIYFSTADNRIRKVDASTGIITTIAGNGVAGYNGDSILAITAQLNLPWGLSLDLSGNLYFADQNNKRIRKITASTGIITTIAGTGVQGFSGDGDPAVFSELSNPAGIVLDWQGDIYFSDFGNKRIRKITASTGIITTIAGTGVQGFSGDGGLALLAEFSQPIGIAIDSAGDVYVADYQSNRIRKITALTGIVTTIAGTGVAGYNGDSVCAITAHLNKCTDLAVDASGNIYILDAANNRVRKVGANNRSIYTEVASDTTYSSTVTVDTIIEIAADTLNGYIITTTSNILAVTYVNSITILKDSTIFASTMCDSSVVVTRYTDTVTTTTIVHDTITSQVQDTIVLISAGLDKTGHLYNLKTYPNPFKNYLVIDPGEEVVDVVLYDALGQAILYTSANGYTTLHPKTARGIYFLKVFYRDSIPITIKVFAE